MDSNRLNFGSSSSSSTHRARMLFLGGPSYPTFLGAGSTLSTEEIMRKRLHFFTFSEGLKKEEYCDELLPKKKQRLTPGQVHTLESSFEPENKLEPDRKNELAKKLGLKPKQVAVWFQNRHARWKTKQLELNLNQLNEAYDSLVADHNSLLKDNDRLRSQVAVLTETLQRKEFVAKRTTSLHMNIQAKAEDQQSDKLDEESYFQEIIGCIVGTVDGGRRVHSEEDGCNYIPADNWWGSVWN